MLNLIYICYFPHYFINLSSCRRLSHKLITYHFSLRWYLKANYNTATVHYERASSKMHENFVGVPGLFFFSNNDPVSTPEMNAVVYKKWEARNIPVRCVVNITCKLEASLPLAIFRTIREYLNFFILYFFLGEHAWQAIFFSKPSTPMEVRIVETLNRWKWQIHLPPSRNFFAKIYFS